MKKFIRSCAVGCALSLPLTIDAAIVTDTSLEKPVDNVMLSINGDATYPTGRRWRFTGTTLADVRQIGQSFYAVGSFSLGEVVFRVAVGDGGTAAMVGADAPSSAFDLKIYRMASASSLSPIEEVYSDSGVLPDSITKGDYLHFELSETFTFTEGEWYGIVLFFHDTGTNRFINLMNGSSYTNGRGLVYNGGTENGGWADSAADFEMHLVSTSIPEPSNMALAAIGGASLLYLGSLRRRKAHL